jgi:hypothetical protein
MQGLIIVYDGSGCRMANLKLLHPEHGLGLLSCTAPYVSYLEIVVNATDVPGLWLRQLQQPCPGRSADPDTFTSLSYPHLLKIFFRDVTIRPFMYCLCTFFLRSYVLYLT